MASDRLYQLMEKRPVLFLVPPILICIAFDLYFGVSARFMVAFALPTLVFTHYYLVGLKLLFKKEKETRKSSGAQRYSFPSYHAGMATCFCTIQGLLWPPSMPIMALLILLTAAGRVQLNLHDWKDVLSGILLVLPVVVAFYLLAFAFA